MMMMELNRLGGQHHSAHQQIKSISDRLQAVEMRQQQIVAFVARTMCTPHFLYQYVNQAIAAEGSRSQQKRLEDCLENSDSTGARKRRRITYTDHCASENGASAGCMDYNQLQLQPQQQQYLEEHASSCEINQETTTSITNTSDDQETAASYDRKLLVQLNRERDLNVSACLDNLIQGAGRAAHNLAYQSRSSCRHHQQNMRVGSTTCCGMSEDVKMKMKTKMRMEQPSSEGYGLGPESEDNLRTVDLNLQPLSMAGDFHFLPSSQIGSGESRGLSKFNIQVNASNTFFEDLESELFWEHLLWPVTMLGEQNGE